MQNSIDTTFYSSPIGIIKIVGNKSFIYEVNFVERSNFNFQEHSTFPILRECIQQLEEYFSGTRKIFDVPVKTSGTAFQEKVWAQLQKIPYAETRSYLDIAEATGNAKAVRAVGGANHNNPVSIIIPCHRVIGKNGRLVGYGGGLDRKKWLLDHERARSL